MRIAKGSKAHPRSRGEHVRKIGRCWWLQGSSPLTRGALRPGGIHGGHHRLIPAHAGSTALAASLLLVPPAHPRSRGEHQISIPHDTKVKGSSPLTRGARDEGIICGRDDGLIPAHAGSTNSTGSSSGPPRAHPRSRGEHRFPSRKTKATSGSSPLTRGARHHG